SVVRILVNDARIAGVKGQNATYSADHVVVAAGAWSAELIAPFGHRVPLETQRGYHATLSDSGVSISRTVVAADRKVFITPMDNGLRVAGTVEFGGLERPPTMERAQYLLEHCKKIFPDARVSQPSYWMGHRPCLPDTMPALGASSRVSGL